MMLFNLPYLLGISACGIRGAQKAKALPSHLQAPATLLLALCSGFAGGVLRDAILLTYPAVLQSESLIDIMAALFAATLFYYADIIDVDTESFVYAADLMGLGTFISIGAEKALISSAGFGVAVILSTITSLGGGISTSILSGATKDIFRSNIRYRIATIICAYLYVTARKEGISQEVARAIFVPCTAIITSFIDHVHLYHFGFLSSICRNPWAITILVLLFIMAHTLWHQYHADNLHENPQPLSIGEKMFCVFHRLLLM